MQSNIKKKIRNFCIIAHIDHGKSTLADRMLEMTGTIRNADHGQILDRMDLEQERGITIKLTPVRMQRKGYEFNLIDTPGHVDFQYEVSRSLAAVEWVVLLVDASQGIQAQTLSTLYMAIDQNLEIIPVLNKIDLPAANPNRVATELENTIWIDKEEIICVSGKTWENVEKVLDTVIERIQSPQQFKEKNTKKFWNTKENTARALIFDSVYDPYKWVVSYLKVVEGTFKAGQNIHLVHTQSAIKPTEVGHFNPEYTADKTLSEGQIGYLVTGEKSVRDAQIWDTLLNFKTSPNKETVEKGFKELAIPWFNPSKPFVYAGVYPLESSDYDKLKDGLDRLTLNDSAIEYSMEDSNALGFGFRCGFLGMLHMDIIKERLAREHNIDTIFTTPTVIYLVKAKTPSVAQIKSGSNIPLLIKSGLFIHCLQKEGIKYDPKEIDNMNEQELIDTYQKDLKLRLMVKSWADMVEEGVIEHIYEPIAEVEVVGPEEYAGKIMELCQEYRGVMKNMSYLDQNRVVRKYNLPLGEIIIDFYDRLKSATKGYATMNYDFKSYEESYLSKLDILVNNDKIEALSIICHKDKAYYIWRDLVKKLKKLIPRHMFAIPLQAGIWSKMIARETIPAMRKDVISKCYGWDVSRKRKLLQKQKEWKKKMKAMWSVSVPSDIFIKMVTKD